MRSILTTTLVGLSLLLAGCATPYQPKGFLGGYSDFQISKDTFSITFSSNTLLDGSRLRQYLLRRAAEVTLAHGFSHFAIIENTDQTDMVTSFSLTSLTVTTIPEESVWIRCFQEDPGPTAKAIDAKEYLRLNFPSASLK